MKVLLPLARLASMLVACAILLAGCSVSGSESVTWDLRQSHTKADVGWKDSADATERSKPMDLKILLPGGRTFSAHVVGAYFDANSGGDLQTLGVYYPPTSLDDGYTEAKKVSKDWNLNTSGLEAWHQQVQQGRSQGLPDSQEPFYVDMVGSSAAGGPVPVAKILNAADESHPFQLSFELQWV